MLVDEFFVRLFGSTENARSPFGLFQAIQAPRPDISQTQSNTSLLSSQRLAKGPTDRQIETIMPNGRRRITPLYIPLDVEGPDLGQPTFSSSTMERSKIIVEKRESNSLPPLASLAPTGSTEEPSRSAPAAAAATTAAAAAAAATAKAKEVIPAASSSQPASTTTLTVASNAAVPGKGKPKRIKPTLLATAQEAEPVAAPTTLYDASTAQPRSEPLQQQIYYQQPQAPTQQTVASLVPTVSGSNSIFPALRLKQPCVIRVDHR